jgi:hypothetical protein
MSTTTSVAATSTSNSSRGNQKQLILTMDRLVWIRRNDASNTNSNNDSNNNSNDDSNNNDGDWWPAVYCDSYSQAMRDFGHRMTETMKMKTVLKVLKTLGEQRTGPRIPVAVPLTGKNQAVVHLETVVVVDNSEDNESDTLRRDFLGDSYLTEFSERNQGNEKATACLSELEELIEQALTVVVENPVDTAVVATETSQRQQQEPSSSEPTSRLPQAAPVEKQGTALAVETSSQDGEVPSERQEPVDQDDFPMDDNDQVQDDDDDEDDVIPSNRLAIPWDPFWGDMESICGWTLRTGGRPYLYVKPGCVTRPGESKLGVDYFDNKEDVQAYARQRYGWRGNDVDDHVDDDQDSEGSVSTAQTPPNQKTQPQDPGLPLYSSSSSGCEDASDDDNSNSSSDESSVEPERIDWKPFWKRCQKAGWTYFKTPAGSLEPNYVFLRPGHDYKTGTAGVDYFLDDKDLIAYHRREDAKEEEQSRQQQRKRKAGKSSHDNTKKKKKATKSTTAKSVVSIGTKSVVSIQTTKSAATAKSSKSAATTKSTATAKTSKSAASAKQAKVKSTGTKSVAGKKRAAATPASKGEKKRQRVSTTSKSASVLRANSKKQKSNSKKNKGQWWKEDAVPTFHAVWPALVKLGFYESDDGYCLPENGTSVTFKSSTGLRKFLCWKGIPNYDKSELESDENTLMQRWVRFANVRVSSRDSVEKLQNISSPKKGDGVKTLLVDVQGWGTYNGNLYIPGADGQAEERRRIENVHYFKEENQDALRCYVRGDWHPPKRRNVSETKELQLRIYAATSSKPLPEFTGLPPRDEFAVLQNMEEEEEEYTEDEHQAETDSDSESNSASEASTVQEKEFNLIPPEEDTPCKEIVEAVKPKKKKLDRRPWYMKEPIPSFLQIWRTLQVFGFCYKNGYSHPLIPGMDFSVDSLRKYVCQYGIPNYEEEKDEVDGADLIRLRRWIVFANVPVSEKNSMSKLENVKIPSDKKIIEMLQQLGFAFFDNRFFPPGADSIQGCRGKRQEGIHFHRGLEGIRVFIRANEDFYIGDPDSVDRPSRKRGKIPTITEEQFLPVRFWAALSGAPLATFKPAQLGTKDETETDKESAVKSQEQEPQEDEGQPRDHSEDAENQPSDASLCSQKEPEEDPQDEEMISSEVVEEKDYLPNDAPLCSQEEPAESPQDADMKSSEVREEGELQPNEVALFSQREPEEDSQDEEMKSNVNLEASEIQCTEESINIETHPPQDEIDTETTLETADIETHDSEAPEEKTDAETNSKEEKPSETEMLSLDETFECERDQDAEEQQDHAFPMTQPQCEEEDSEDEDDEEDNDSPAHPGPLMKFFAESFEYATGAKARRVTAGPADSASPLEHDWEAQGGKTESNTNGWPVSDHLGRSRFGEYSYTSKPKSSRVTDSAISEHARVALSPAEDRGVMDSLCGWGFGTQAEDDEEDI